MATAAFGAGDDAGGEPAIALEAFTIGESRLSQAEASTLKLALPLQETPRSLTVLDDARIREQDFQNLASTLDYVPGVFGFGANADSYHFFSRGFNMGQDETKIDGFTGFVTGGSFTPSLFGIEQVVFLRGPAGLLYGAAAAPGGMINLVTKKPQRHDFTRIDARYSTYAGGGVQFGTHASHDVELDVNRRLRADGSLLFRFSGEVENRGHFNDGIRDRGQYALASLTWRFGPEERFELTPVFQYDRQPFAESRGLAISPSTSLSTADGKAGPVNRSDLSPVHNWLGAGQRRQEHHIAGFDFRARLTSSWRASAAYRFMATDTDVNQFSVQAASLRQLNSTDPRSWVIDRRQTVSQTDRRNHAVDLSTSYEVASHEAWRNLTQLGFNARSYRTTAARSAATQPYQSPINIYTAAAATPLVDRQPALVDSYLSDDVYWNGWVQNQTAYRDRVIVTVGVGYGEQRFGRDYPAAQLPPANLAAITAPRRGDVTPNAAVVYKVTPALAVYASHATSYQPADGSLEDIDGVTGSFRPVSGRNLELGAKYDLGRQRGAITASVFQTELTNVLVQSEATQLNRNGNRYYTQSGGGRRARGAEVSAELRLLDNWRLSATGSLLDARYRGEGRIEGSPAEKTPRKSFSVYQRYDFTRGPLQNLGLSVGWIWQDARLSAARTAAAPDPLTLPAFSRVDAGLFYRVNRHWDVSVNCQNVFDRLYFVSGATGAALEVGAPRSMSIRVGYAW